jgi:hypothetical protein
VFVPSEPVSPAPGIGQIFEKPLEPRAELVPDDWFDTGSIRWHLRLLNINKRVVPGKMPLRYHFERVAQGTPAVEVFLVEDSIDLQHAASL